MDIDGNCGSCYDGYTLTDGACVECTFTGCTQDGRSVTNNACQCTSC